jgi:RNA polymerase sigma-70 factor, ECF subfamily
MAAKLSMELAHIRELHSFSARLLAVARNLPMGMARVNKTILTEGMDMDKVMEKSHTEDIELAANVSSAGDMSSFEVLYKRYFKKVYLICLKMTANPADAEDLTQEVFIHVQRTLKSYRGDSSLSSWLHRVTVNHVLMRFRKKSTRSETTTSDGELPEMPININNNSLSSPMIDRIALSDAIQHLANGYRQIFLMHDLLGYGHEEIADKLGISIGTSKSQLHKARMKLRGMLATQAKEAEVSVLNEAELNLGPAYAAA